MIICDDVATLSLSHIHCPTFIVRHSLSHIHRQTFIVPHSSSDIQCPTFIVRHSLLLLLLKKVSSARLGESDIHPISPKTPAPQYQPIDRKKRKGKRVEDYSRDRAA